MNKFKDFAKLLIDNFDENIAINEEMKNHTSFKVGGPADIIVTPKNSDNVLKIIKLCKENNVPYLVIGRGSNLLVRDGGIRGVIIQLTELRNIRVNGELLTADCGAELWDVSEAALKESLTGFEFACGIPGCIGGAVAMNAGAYGPEMKDVIQSALVIDDKNEVVELSNEELELTYRNSIILKKRYVVLKATFKLAKANKEEIKATIDDLQYKRTSKQPLEYPSAGSTFKRPEGYFTGKLIQDCNLKGFSIGGAQVSEKHSGFIINKDRATASDILNLIKHVQDTVFNEYGVELTTEVRIIGEDK